MKSVSILISLSVIIGCKTREQTPVTTGNLKEMEKKCFSCDMAPEGTIFCDDFESESPLANRYFEYDNNNGDFVRIAGSGRDGTAGMQVIWQPGESAAGSLKKSFGRTPGEYISKNASFPDKDFNEIYWRVDVKREAGWSGGGADKLTRAIVFADSAWSEGLMAHIWSSGNYLVMDPASGITEKGALKSTKYNDFDNLRWLGSRKGDIDLFSDENADKWFCVVAHVKLNTPGKSDGIFEFWINDKFQGGSYDLNWHGDWNKNPENYMINSVLIENYWNKGSPKLQRRYLDNVLISSKPIKCNCNPAVEK